MQDQINPTNHAEEFQEVEPNCSGRLSYVSSQHAMIPSSRSMLSATKDCRLTHGIHLDDRKTFLEINFLRLIQPEIIHKKCTILSNLTENEDQFPQAIGTGTLFKEGRRL